MSRIDRIERALRDVYKQKQKGNVTILYDSGDKLSMPLYAALDLAACVSGPHVIQVYGENTEGIRRLLEAFEQYGRTGPETSVTRALAEELLGEGIHVK